MVECGNEAERRSCLPVGLWLTLPHYEERDIGDYHHVSKKEKKDAKKNPDSLPQLPN